VVASARLGPDCSPLAAYRDDRHCRSMTGGYRRGQPPAGGPRQSGCGWSRRNPRRGQPEKAAAVERGKPCGISIGGGHGAGSGAQGPFDLMVIGLDPAHGRSLFGPPRSGPALGVSTGRSAIRRRHAGRERETSRGPGLPKRDILAPVTGTGFFAHGAEVRETRPGAAALNRTVHCFFCMWRANPSGGPTPSTRNRHAPQPRCDYWREIEQLGATGVTFTCDRAARRGADRGVRRQSLSGPA